MADPLFSTDPFPLDQVFTPRNPNVNSNMYVSRAPLENAVSRALKGAQHVLIHGETGSGKSWLCKRLESSDRSYYWHWVNLATAVRVGSIVKAIQSSLAKHGSPQKSGYTETKSASVNAMVAEGSLEHEATYEYEHAEPFLAALIRVNALSNNKPTIIVLENLEQIFDNDDCMKELGSLIVMCDDATYAQYKTKFLIIGIPSHVRDYYAKVPNLRTVASRLVEIPEVAAFTDKQTSQLVETGFDLLRIKLDPLVLDTVQQRVHFVTLGIPLYVHEYCLELSQLLIADHSLRSLATINSALEKADTAWLGRSLSSVSGEIESLMNSKETRIGRKNQVLYALGRVDGREFDTAQIEKLVKQLFPQSTEHKTLNIGGMLSEIATKNIRVIQRTAKGDKYVFVDPKFRMCLRTLRCDSHGRITRLAPGIA